MSDRLKATAKSEAVGSLWDASIRWEVDEEASVNPGPRVNWWKLLSNKLGTTYTSTMPTYTEHRPGYLVLKLYGDGPYSVEVDSPHVQGGVRNVGVSGSPWTAYMRTSIMGAVTRTTTTETVNLERVEWKGSTSQTIQSKPEGEVTIVYQTRMRGADGSDVTITEMEPGVWAADKDTFGVMIVTYSRRVHIVTVAYQYFPEDWTTTQITDALTGMLGSTETTSTSSGSWTTSLEILYEKLNDYPIVILVRDENNPDNQDIILADRWRQKTGGGSSGGGASDEPIEEPVADGLPEELTEVERNNETKTVTFSSPVTSTTVEYIKDITFEYETGAIDPETEQPVKKQIKFVYEVA